MRILSLIVLLFFGWNCSAQTTEVAVQIDSITHIDPSPNERLFTVHYSVTNKTKDVISLILNTRSIKPNMYNHSSWIPSYRLYQEENVVETNSIFNSKKNDAALKQLIQALEENRKDLADFLAKQTEEIKQKTRKEILESVLQFQGNETKKFTANLSWDKNRYHKFEDNEYYLNNNDTHFLDLFLYFNKHELASNLLAEDLKNILETPNLISGWITSNKFPINFKD